MRWLAFGTYDVQRHPRVAVLIEGLRAAGDEVVELNVPLDLDTAGRVAMLRQPWRLPVLAAKLARCWLALIRRARRIPGGQRPDAVLVGYLGHFDVRLARRLFRRTPIALDHLVSAAATARDRGLAGGGGPKARLMVAIDDGALRSADLVIVDTAEHAEALPAFAADRSVIVPVGAEASWFAAGDARGAGPRQRSTAGDARGAGPRQRSTAGDARGDGPRQRSTAGDARGDGPTAGNGSPDRPLRVVFFGLFTPLHGTTTIGAALGTLADAAGIEVTMVGTGQEYDACRRAAAANPHVTWLDWVPGGELPGFVAGYDVCLGIFGTTAKARKVVPTKVFQGAAAGCAVLTSDTPPQRDALGEAALLVPPGDPAALAAALRGLRADPDQLVRLRAAASALAAARFAPVTVVAPLRRRMIELHDAPHAAAQEVRTA